MESVMRIRSVGSGSQAEISKQQRGECNPQFLRGIKA
jgi:hypothetical protein